MRSASSKVATIVWFAVAFALGAAVPAAEPAILVRVAVFDGRHTESIVGVLESENDQEVKLFDLAASKRRTIQHDQVKYLRKNISPEEAANAVGLPSFAAWGIRQALPADPGRVGRVSVVVGGSIFVTLGKADGVREGEVLQASRGEVEIKDPDTGKVLEKYLRKLAKLQVTDAQEKTSKAKLLDDSDVVEIQMGDTVRAINAEKRVAVLPFADENGEATQAGVAFSEQLIGALVSAGVPTVERTRLSAVLTELAMQRTGRFDDKSQQRIGKQVGAFALITGSTIPSPHGRRTQVSVRMTDVQTGAVLYAFTQDVFARGLSRANTGVGFPPPDRASPIATSKPLPTRYFGQTYAETYRRVNGKWEVVDNKTGRIVRVDNEVSRTEDSVELFSPSRNDQFRLMPTHIEQKINGKWQWTAKGHWETSSPAGAQSIGQPGIKFLSDLQEKSVEFWEYQPNWGFSKHGVIGCRQKTAGDLPLVLGGKPSPNGIFAHPKSNGISSLKYDVGNLGYTTFQATVGVADARRYNPQTPVTFEVYGDGKLLWKSKRVKQWGQPQECNKVDITGVGELELRVNCPGDAAFALAVWCEPRLLN